jgi:hypothetical protein
LAERCRELGELQQSELGADNLLFGRHGVLQGSVVRIDSVIAEFYLLEDLLKNMRIGELIGALNYSDNGKRPFAVDPRY